MNNRLTKGELLYNPEIERTARRLRKEFREKHQEEKLYLEILFSEAEMARERTLKELSAPTLGTQPLNIVSPELEKPLKLNSGFINLLPKFYGRANENPQRHLQEFIVVCSSMQIDGVEQDQIQLLAFPFSLVDAAKDWLYYLPVGSITTWALLENAFLEKFLPASRVGAIGKEICSIKQKSDESLYEYRERFDRLCASCPQHQIRDGLLIQYFYDGLSPKDESIIDAASGGVLMNKTATEAKQLIDNMALDSQQYSSREDVKGVNGVDLSSLKNELQENSQQIATLTTLMSKLVSNNSHANVSYAVSDSSHVRAEDVNAMNGFPYSFQKKYDPFLATYNEGWDHPNLKYGPPRPNQSYRAPRPLVPNSSAQNPHTSPSLEDMLKQLATQIGQVHSQGTQHQQKTDAHLHQLDTQISQMCTSLSNIESKLSGSLPSQPLPNPPRDRILSIRLKGADDLEALPFETEGANLSKTVVNEKKIPLAVGLSLVPKYATFFRGFMDAQNLSVGEYVEISHCSFSIPYGIGAFHYGDCLLDLGADVNTMPSHIYESYELGPLSNTSSILELGDGSIIHPLGILENINIKLGDLEFATDFYITESYHSFPIILGKPFLRTSRAIIDVAKGEVTVRCAKQKLRLNFYDIYRNLYIIEHDVFNLEDYCLEVLGVNVIEILLDEMVQNFGLEKLFELAVNELTDI